MIKKLLIVLFTCACLQLQAQVNIITTIAGTGETGYSGNNGPATNAKFNRPCVVCLDPSGNLLTCDGFNHVVRKINLSTGIVTTIAGTDTGGYNGDNILATNARLFVPEGICIDSANNIYIADAGNYRIRKIFATTGIITTIAGNGTVGYSGDNNIATWASFNAPCGMCIYNNSFYITDYNNYVLRKLDLTTGIISHVAGTGTPGYSGDNGPAADAQLNSALDVFCDAGGNIFIADQLNAAIRRIDATTGIINTVAGNGTTGYSGDNGLATAAQMDQAAAVFVDKNSNLFIADYGNGAIRRVDGHTGIITTVAGGVAGYGGDGGPATDAKLRCADVWVDDGGAIYIADYVNQRIRRVNNALKVTSPGLSEGEEVMRTSPNPTKGKFEVEVATGAGIISVCTMAGQEVFKSATFSSKMEIDISNQPPGMYMVYVMCGEDRYVGKVLLQ